MTERSQLTVSPPPLLHAGEAKIVSWLDGFSLKSPSWPPGFLPCFPFRPFSISTHTNSVKTQTWWDDPCSKPFKGLQSHCEHKPKSFQWPTRPHSLVPCHLSALFSCYSPPNTTGTVLTDISLVVPFSGKFFPPVFSLTPIKSLFKFYLLSWKFL